MAAAAPQRPGRPAERTIPGGRRGGGVLANCGTVGTGETVEAQPCPSARRPLSAGARSAFSESAAATAALRTALPQARGWWCGPARACASAGGAGSWRRPGAGGEGRVTAPEQAWAPGRPRVARLEQPLAKTALPELGDASLPSLLSERTSATHIKTKQKTTKTQTCSPGVFSVGKNEGKASSQATTSS